MIAKFVQNIVTLSIGIIGFVGGLIWAISKSWNECEPIILFAAASIELLAFIVIKGVNYLVSKELDYKAGNDPTENNNRNEKSKDKDQKETQKERNLLIEAKKPVINILFIDDDTNFKVVQILKNSGWKNTKSVIDVNSIDSPIIQKSDIIFVDINGVGKILELEYQGLDLALMIKQKYDHKKVIIYSAKRNFNSFHEAWDIIDFKLEKNALPYQFQNTIENFSLKIKK
jgi:hypothetical protein